MIRVESFYFIEEFVRAREERIRTFLRLPGEIPSHDTFNRLFQALAPTALAETFAQWPQGLRQSLDSRAGAASPARTGRLSPRRAELRVYPDNPACWREMRAQAKWRRAS